MDYHHYKIISNKQKLFIMKPNRKLLAILIILFTSTGISAFILTQSSTSLRPLRHKKQISEEKDGSKGCVFRSLMGEDSLAQNIEIVQEDRINASIGKGEKWLMESQSADGGWGAGFHAYQKEMDPSKVPSDPATTALSCMALLRIHQNIDNPSLQKGIQYLIQSVTNSQSIPENITDLTSTQPQTKLGGNIDVVLTAQFFSNVLDYTQEGSELDQSIRNSLAMCTQKIEKGIADDGSAKKGGWAGVLQSSFSTIALESADKKGIAINRDKLEKSRDYQKGNYDMESGAVNTEKGAGVMLYSLSSTSRNSAKESREIKEKVQQAKAEGRLQAEDEINMQNLRKIGLSEEDAHKAYTAYEVNQATKSKAQQDEILSGFGNNGGEEFLSYLQTSEGLIIAKDNDWSTWYKKISATMLNIQNRNGSWNGHHCITSPVFCTATCLLVLSIQNDIKNLQAAK